MGARPLCAPATDAPVRAQMPFMDGIECTRRIRAWERTTGASRLRILALSANGDDAACQRDCRDAGMDGVLCKPVSYRTLREELQRVLEPSASPPSTPGSGVATATSAAPCAAPSAVPSSGRPVVFDARTQQKLYGGDAATFHKAVSAFYRSGRGRLEAIERAAASGNLSELQFVTHLLKGTCVYAGAYALHAAAREFNDAVKQAIALHETELSGLDGFMARLRDEMRLVLEAQSRFLEERGVAIAPS